MSLTGPVPATDKPQNGLFCESDAMVAARFCNAEAILDISGNLCRGAGTASPSPAAGGVCTQLPTLNADNSLEYLDID
jgi:hypothetical protein